MADSEAEAGVLLTAVRSDFAIRGSEVPIRYPGVQDLEPAAAGSLLES